MGQEEVQKNLDKLGFGLGEIVEIIITSQNLKNEPNAAPMGVARRGPRTIEVKPFLETTTYRNLRETSKGVANISYDVDLFLETAFKDENAKAEWFEKEEDSPHLKGADALLYFTVLGETKVSESRACFLCQVDATKVLEPFPRVFSRGFAATIEAVIHVTRIEAFMREGKSDEVEKYLQKFRVCKEVVERVSPKESPNRRVMKVLEEKILRWK